MVVGLQEDFSAGVTLELKPKGRGRMTLVQCEPSKKRQKEQHLDRLGRKRIWYLGRQG